MHGALLVHEPRFTGELMASVLSIPASKSLLRRHLFTRFNELVGADILREKREVEDNQSIAPLRPDSKVKVRNKTLVERIKGEVYGWVGKLGAPLVHSMFRGGGGCGMSERWRVCRGGHVRSRGGTSNVQTKFRLSLAWNCESGGGVRVSTTSHA